MKRFLLATTLLASLVPLSAALAAPLTGLFTITVWNGNGGGSVNSPGVQALPTNPLFTPGALVANFTFDGALNFTTNTNNILSFFQNGGTFGGLDAAEQALMAGTTLSLPGFTNTTLVRIVGNTANDISGNLLHDDGVSLFQGGVNVVNPGAAAPTNVAATPFALSAGAFTLWYVEANALPAQLTMDVTRVPEPASLALFGAGLLGLGLVRRRAARIA